MQLFQKPKNRWGWARVTGWAALAGLLAWTLLAAALRSAGGIAWLAWSGYQGFALLDGFELAALPLLLALAAGWLEEQDHKSSAEQSTRLEAERAAAEEQARAIRGLQEALQAGLPGASPAAARERMVALVRAALPGLDGKHKGEVLRWLFEQGRVAGENGQVEWEGADFSGVRLPRAQLAGLRLEGALMKKAQLDGARLAGCRLRGASLSKAFLRQADLRDAGLQGCDLSGARLENASLDGADLRGARLAGAFLIKASLLHCALDGAPNRAAAAGGIDATAGPQTGPLDQAILVETVLPDGRAATNAKGKEYLRKKEMAFLIDRL